MTLEKVKFDLNEVVQEIYVRFKEQYRDKNADYAVDDMESPLRDMQLPQWLVNLIYINDNLEKLIK
jgi:hypothetical protein